MADLVTGAFSFTGRAIANQLLAEGAMSSPWSTGRRRPRGPADSNRAVRVR
jgi:hypothetical protein